MVPVPAYYYCPGSGRPEGLKGSVRNGAAGSHNADRNSDMPNTSLFPKRSASALDIAEAVPAGIL